jgi:hypothetical protein|tara:strand:- start:337 stop:639 length:303 start_codon:yes stop_codon:yes gene_type:complete
LIFRIVLVLTLFIIFGCKEEEKGIPVPTGHGKTYGDTSWREDADRYKSPCRLRKVERSPELEGSWQCVYDHPKEEKDDIVTVGQKDMCPNMIYCDRVTNR